MCSGPTSRRQLSTRRWPNTLAAAVASAAREMRTRLISAAVLVPVVVAVFLVGHPFIGFGIALVAALGGLEVAQLVRRAGLPANLAIAVATPPLAVMGFLMAGVPHWILF